jgi:hypothetical protein
MYSQNNEKVGSAEDVVEAMRFWLSKNDKITVRSIFESYDK